MATSTEARTRAPRGTRNVTAAFLTALNDIPDARKDAVAKAAQAAIRDALKLLRDRARASKAAGRTTTGRTGVAA